MIKSMKCYACGSEDVTFQLCLDNGVIWINQYGYEVMGGGFVLDLIDKAILPQRDWDFLGLTGKLHSNPNHICCPSTGIEGECAECEDEASLIIEFSDGAIYTAEEDKAFIKLIDELRNP